MKYIHPNFFIVGGMRCGTTSLWSYLRQHPEIYMPQFKEPIFFCTSHKSKQCIRDYKAYLDLFSSVTNQKAVGEASAAYLTSPESAELIYSAYPDAKIIISLRNPVEQAFSVYQWMIREGWEWITPFEKALRAEEGRWKDEKFKQTVEYSQVYFYSRIALHSEQISRYLDLFPRENIKVILFDDLKNNPVETVQNIYKFLDVDPSFLPNIEIHNKSRMPLWGKGQFFFKKNMPILIEKYRIPSFFKKILKQYAVEINLSLGSYRSCNLKLETRCKLLQIYRNDIYKTSQLIEKDTSNWLRI